MISFRTKDDAVASGLSIVSVLVLAFTLVWLLMPKASAASIKTNQKSQQKQYESEIKKAQETRAEAEAAVTPLLWTGSTEEVTPQVYAQVSKFLKSRNVTLLAFRPLKPVDLVGLTQLSFTVSIDGSFPNAMQFVKDLESPQSKLAVNLIQVASSEGTSDRITGTIGVVAYTRLAKPIKASNRGGVGNAQKPK